MPFTPTALSNLWGWWKTDAGLTMVGSDVGTLADQSGNGRTLVGLSGKEVNVQTNALNGFSALVSRNGSESLMRTQSGVNFPDVASSGCTIYIVAAQEWTNDEDGVFLSTGDTQGFRQPTIRRFGIASDVQAGAITDSSSAPTLGITDGTFYTIRLRLDTNNTYIAVNNASEYGTGRNGSPAAYVAAQLFLFGKLSGSDICNKKIVEVIVYTGDKTGNDSALVEYYLQQKYNHFTWTDPIPTYTETAVINFPTLPTKTVGDADFAPGATSNSPAPITYTSSNLAVATIVSGNINIVGAGTSTITASQGATTGYSAAADATQTLTVNSNNSNSNSMANEIFGSSVYIQQSDDGSTNWKTLICREGGELNLSSDIRERITQCGTIQTPGPVKGTISIDGVADSSPSGTQISHQDIAGIVVNRTKKYFRVTDNPTTVGDSNVFAQAAGYYSSLRIGLPVDDAVDYSAEIVLSGTIGVTP